MSRGMPICWQKLNLTKSWSNSKMNLKTRLNLNYRCSIGWVVSWSKCSCSKPSNKTSPCKMSKSILWKIIRLWKKWRNMSRLHHQANKTSAEVDLLWIRLKDSRSKCFHHWEMLYSKKYNLMFKIKNKWKMTRSWWLKTKN